MEGGVMGARGPKARPEIDRLREKYRVLPNGCWEWTAGRFSSGYGQFNREAHAPGQRRGAHAHRVSYEILVGPIPEGLELDHLCRNRACVNPAHLEPVTHLENVRRGIRVNPSHCPQGHEYTPDNKRVIWPGKSTKAPSFACRECHRESERRRRQERRERAS